MVHRSPSSRRSPSPFLSATVPALAVLVLGLFLALPAGAAELAAAETPADRSPVCLDLPTATAPLEGPLGAGATWQELDPEGVSSLPQCPAPQSCNATHCAQSSFCATESLGNACCVGTSCLFCPSGQTVLVTRCRCIGGGCEQAGLDNSVVVRCG